MLQIKDIAKLENLASLKQELASFLKASAIANEKIPDVELAIEELLFNIISYSYPNAEGWVELTGKEHPKILQFQIIDEGIPFDPTENPAPDLDGPLAERSRGGMGIFLAKKLIDQITYQREDNKNILTLTVNK